jgi:hypothetical protein
MAQPPGAVGNNLQKQLNYKFHIYRTTGAPDVDYNSNNYTNFPFPKLGRLIRLLPVSLPSYDASPPANVLSGRYRGVRNTALVFHTSAYVFQRPRRLRNVYLARRRLENQLRPGLLRHVKDLGYGGNGLAALFFLKRPGSREREYFVAKCNHNVNNPALADFNLEREKTATNVSFCG